MKLTFLTSAASDSDWPKETVPEVALAGRSNAGKSTFLNALAGQKVAKVSQVPGKTRLLNFFAAGENYRLVDMPGYGFAARSGDEIRTWENLVESYLRSRERLVGVLLFQDIRREFSEDERQVAEFLKARGRPVALVLTKADQLKANDVRPRLEEAKRRFGAETVFVISDRDPSQVKSVEDFVFKNWVKGK